MTVIDFNETEIQITSVYFRKNQTEHKLESYPKRMLLGGREYNFLEQSARYLLQKGQELFDVTDGQTAYRLRHSDSRWTLVDMKAVA